MPPVVKIYTRRWCGYCTAALRLLEQKGLAFEQIDVSGNRQMRAWLEQATGQHTVPQIFIGERSIGGYRELRALERDQQLDALLADSSSPA